MGLFDIFKKNANQKENLNQNPSQKCSECFLPIKGYVWKMNNKPYCQECYNRKTVIVQQTGGQRPEDFDFQMLIIDVFFLRGKGIVIDGIVQKGQIFVDEYIVANGKSFKVRGIKTENGISDKATVGTAKVGLLLDETESADYFKSGDIVTSKRFEDTAPKSNTFVCDVCGKELPVKYRHSGNVCAECYPAKPTHTPKGESTEDNDKTCKAPEHEYLDDITFIRDMKPVISPSENKKNIETHKQEIEDYGKFLAKVYLCTSHNAVGNQTDYVCIDRTTEELFSFSAKVIGRSGAFDQCIFSKQPQKITTYSQLLDCLHSKAKKYFSDLSETNWQKYFSFMLLPPDYNAETLRKQLLSRDSGIVRTAIFAVHNLVLKSTEERKALLSDAHQNILLIEENLASLNMGGIFVSANRFANRAIQIIKGNNSDQCFCRLLIDEFGPSANGLAKEGFLLIQEDEKINDYSVRGIVECPICKKRYSIIEEYTGWHIPTSIHCSEIPNTDL